DVEQETYTVDSVHSSVVFRIEHMGIAYFYGRFNDPSGTYNIDGDNPGASFIDISVDAKKVDTGNERRDRHLRSPDFFNAEQFPTISFTARSAEKTGDNTLVMSGELTMLGVTKPAQANVTFIGKAESHQGFKSGFE